jgi:hypothetical protein
MGGDITARLIMLHVEKHLRLSAKNFETNKILQNIFLIAIDRI